MNIFGSNLTRTFYVGQSEIPVLVCARKGSKKINITVRTDGTVRVTHPRLVRNSYIMKFVESKSEWIESKVKYFKNRNPILSLKHKRLEYIKYSEKAIVLVKERLKYFNQYYNLEYKNISVKNQKTRWGSCSSRKNLSFNYKIIFLPPELQDYLVVHELCHLKEMNHSKKFWNLVGEKILDYKKLSKSLRIGDFK